MQFEKTSRESRFLKEHFCDIKRCKFRNQETGRDSQVICNK